MWGAIKSDLLSFVSTITDDTTKTISRVLGEEEQEEEDLSMQEKKIADLRRSFETYDTPVRESDQRDYEKFKKKFNLSSAAADIAGVLDQEPEVSRFYAELVPVKLTPEEFWSRLFFRVDQILRNGSARLDEEDDEEELVWEEEETFTPETSEDSVPTTTSTSSSSVPPPAPGAADATTTSTAVPMHRASEAVSGVKASAAAAASTSTASGTRTGSSQTAQLSSTEAGTNTQASSTTHAAAQTATATTAAASTSTASGPQVNVHELISVNEHMHTRVSALEEENQRLQQHEQELYRRIQELEALLSAQGNGRENLPEPPTPSSQLALASANSTPQSKRASDSNNNSGSMAPATTPPSHAYHNTATPPTAMTAAVTTGAAAESEQKKKSTAKKLFDSPAAPGAGAVGRGGADSPQEATSVASIDTPLATVEAPIAAASVVTAPAVTESASQSSDDSAVVVSRSDVNSLVDDDLPAAANANASFTSVREALDAPNSPTASPTAADSSLLRSPGGAVPVVRVREEPASVGTGLGVSSFSRETAKYLAALDDQDDEEDGWN